MILAALDFVDDRAGIIARDRRLQLEEGAMRAGEEGAIFLGLAAEARDLGLEVSHDDAAFTGAGAEHLAEAAGLRVPGGCDIAIYAVDCVCDQTVEHVDFMADLRHSGYSVHWTHG